MKKEIPNTALVRLSQLISNYIPQSEASFQDLKNEYIYFIEKWNVLKTAFSEDLDEDVLDEDKVDEEENRKNVKV